LSMSTAKTRWALANLMAICLLLAMSPTPATANPDDTAPPVTVANVFTDRWVVAPSVTAAPTIDGNLDEAWWADAPALTDFRTVYSLAPSPSSPRYLIGYDDGSLYVGGTISAD